MQYLEEMSSHALSRSDGKGYRLMQRGILEIEEFGAIKPVTRVEIIEWIRSIS